MKQRLSLTFLSVVIFGIGLVMMGKALYRWVTYTPPAETIIAEQGGERMKITPFFSGTSRLSLGGIILLH